MNPKLIITILFSLFIFFLNAQTLQKLPTLAGLAHGTTSRFTPRDSPTKLPRRPPIVLFNGVEFKAYYTFATYFDFETVSDIRTYHAHTDSARIMGDARHGAAPSCK